MPRIAFTNETNGDGGKFLIQPGQYPVTFTEYKFGVSKGEKTAGAEQVAMKLCLNADCWIWDTITFAPSTAWRASAFLLAFGIRADEGSEMDFDARVLDPLIGRECQVEIKHDTFKGKTKNKVKAYIPQSEAKVSAKAKPPEDLSIKEENIPF
jgi:hypothetical protein